MYKDALVATMQADLSNVVIIVVIVSYMVIFLVL